MYTILKNILQINNSDSKYNITISLHHLYGNDFNLAEISKSKSNFVFGLLETNIIFNGANRQWFWRWVEM